MSGPKSSGYNVEAERKRQLKRQMENRINQIKNEIRQKEKLLQYNQNISRKNDAHYMEKIKETRSQLSYIHERLLSYQKKIYINEDIVNDLKNVLNNNRINDKISLEQQLLYMEGLLKTGKEELKRGETYYNSKSREKSVVRKSVQEKINFEKIQTKTQHEFKIDERLKDFEHKELKNNTKELSNSTENELIKFGGLTLNQEDIKFGKNTSFIKEQNAVSANEVNNELNLEYIKLNELIEYYLLNMPSNYKKELLDFKESLGYIVSNNRLDDDYKLSKLRIRKEAFLLTKEKYDTQLKYKEEEKNKFYNLYEEYLAICELSDEEAEIIELDDLNIVSCMNILKNKVNEKREELTKDMEAKYVSESINSVMKELGYDILVSDYMTTAKRNIMHNIYDFGDKNVVNVYTSDNGSLMFEVTGIKEKEELSNSDKLRIKEGMDKFCPQYQKVKDALAKRGISIANESLLPADVSFAKTVDLENKLGVREKSKKNSRRNNNKQKYKTL